MGGAERNARKKKQEQRAAKAVVAARGTSGDRTKVVIGIAVVVVLALVVIGGVIWTKSGEDEPLTVPQGITGVSAPIVREAGVVVVGKDSAKVTIDLYEDFLCPACGNFKKIYGDQIKREIEAGTLKVRYHALPFLIKYSTPEGYSRDSANAALCAADENKFWEYHETLFAKQPEEGGPGYTKEELVKLGTDLGITGETFKQCVDSGAHEKDAQAELDAVKGTGNFAGTPTVMKDGQIVEWDDQDWLTNMVK
ncbi:protein-disulfide isomerase [Saccharothrix sp. ALI-22-I]|uniref:DsbA family protein n=1 Tax=Saccharothrix sp. ALI-22-I TaxID=1933778 RepID=UPI00097C41D2|nr:thioredoxin domain-containing protein [Saccharothrix sp. ALI-22-I]ONI92405.1 protein-disulfide isomerase [Saccharothrix sp. ALI-22-I]